jgi:hypothetical protein
MSIVADWQDSRRQQRDVLVAATIAAAPPYDAGEMAADTAAVPAIDAEAAPEYSAASQQTAPEPVAPPEPAAADPAAPELAAPELAAPEPAAPELAASEPAASEPAAEAALVSDIVGFVDGLDFQRRLIGWAYVRDAPARRVTVSLFSDGAPIVSGLADLARPDVKEAGHGDGFSGFALALPEYLFDGRARRLSVLYEASDLAPLPAELELDLPAAVAPPGLPPGLPAAPRPRAEEPPGEIYVPGHYVLCAQPYPLPAYHTRGWHEPEQDFTWIDGVEGVLEMMLRRPPRSYTLMLEVVPNGVGNRLQTLEVFFDYLRIGFFEVPSPTTLAIEIPGELFILRKTRINLHCRNAVVGTDHGVADARRLGIAIRGWSIA